MERLDKLLANLNFGSRKEVNKLIKSKAVAVNSEICTVPSTKIDIENDTVTINGKAIATLQLVYYMMNKPADTVCSTDDKDTTVLDILPQELRRNNLFPAGRLDKDTTGLLIITNDGELAHRMLSPKKHVSKEYIATLCGKLDNNAVVKFKEGIQLKDFKCLPAKLKILENGDNQTVSITVKEGKFHQVKRMCRACGAEVVKLQRVRIGGLNLDPSLKEGEVRALTAEELEQIFMEVEE